MCVYVCVHKEIHADLGNKEPEISNLKTKSRQNERQRGDTELIPNFIHSLQSLVRR